MIEHKYELDMYPIVNNRSVVNLFPTKLYLEWLNYVHGSNVGFSLNGLEPITFFIEDFHDKSDFEYWLQTNYQLLFEIRLTYSCIDKSLWPAERTFNTFNSWFQVRYSNMILDLEDESINTSV
jgi:hypothetical protein